MDTLIAIRDDLLMGLVEDACRRVQATLADDDWLDRRATALPHRPILVEIDSLFRAGLFNEAERRLGLYLNPKFSSRSACAEALAQHRSVS